MPSDTGANYSNTVDTVVSATHKQMCKHPYLSGSDIHIIKLSCFMTSTVFLNLPCPSFAFPCNSFGFTTGFQECRVENVGQTHSNADQVEEELTVVQYKNNDDAGIFGEVSGLKETKPAFTPHNPPVDCDPCALRFKRTGQEGGRCDGKLCDTLTSSAHIKHMWVKYISP